MLFSAMMIGATAQNVDNATERDDTLNVVESVYDMAPEYPGGMEALTDYLRKNLNYPDIAAKYGVEGLVIMTFIVDEDGALKNIAAHDCKIRRFNTTKFNSENETTQKSLRRIFALQFAKEGARVIRKMPKWTPGKLHDKAIKVRLNLPIRFSIPDK